MHHQFYNLDDPPAGASGISFSKGVGSGSWCIVAVTPAKTENIAVVEKLLKGVHNRRTIYLSNSKRV